MYVYIYKRKYENEKKYIIFGLVKTITTKNKWRAAQLG